MSYDSEVLADSPAVYFKLAEASGTTMVDSSGNGRNGTYVGTITYGTAGPTSDGATAISINGGYGTFGTTGLPSGSSSYTLEGWGRPVTTGGPRGIVGIGTYNASTGNANTLRLATGGGGLKNYWWGNDYELFSGSVLTNVWTHYAATWNGTTQEMFVNGVSIGSRTPSAPSVVLNAPTVGLGWTGNSEYWDGRLARVAVYTTALSSTRIAAHYAAA